jgi:hypothetical protein
VNAARTGIGPTLRLVAREVRNAFADPDPHLHTKPWKRRCTRCGHRIVPKRPGGKVRETRKLWPWLMAYEPIGRALAIRQGLLMVA